MILQVLCTSPASDGRHDLCEEEGRSVKISPRHMNYQLLEAIIIRVGLKKQVTCEAVGAHQREVPVVLLEWDVYVLILCLEQGLRRILSHLFDAWGEAGSNQKREYLHYLCEIWFLHPISHPDLLCVEGRRAIHHKL